MFCWTDLFCFVSFCFCFLTRKEEMGGDESVFVLFFVCCLLLLGWDVLFIFNGAWWFNTAVFVAPRLPDVPCCSKHHCDRRFVLVGDLCWMFRYCLGCLPFVRFHGLVVVVSLGESSGLVFREK